MEATVEETECGAEAKCGATPHFDLPRTDLERKVKECWDVLQGAVDKSHEAGMAFGLALIELRAESKHGEWLPRLEELGIRKERARYWMAKAGGEPTDRHKKAQEKTINEGLAWATAGPHWLVVWPLCESECSTPSPDSREEVTLCKLAQLSRLDELNWPLIDHPVCDYTFRNEYPEPSRSLLVEFVVINFPHALLPSLVIL
jgi:hypothetical protein